MTAKHYAEITALFGDGEHAFRLDWDRLRELEEKTDCGPMELFRRIGASHWRAQDIAETIRLGLVGAGMKAPDAVVLVRRYVLAAPIEHNVPLALDILGAALVGSPEYREAQKAGGETVHELPERPDDPAH